LSFIVVLGPFKIAEGDRASERKPHPEQGGFGG
jgi:hypothetical protein